VDRDAHPSARGEVRHQRQTLLVLLADHPSATVDLQQHGRAGAGRKIGTVIDVEAVTLGAVVDVLDVAYPSNAATFEVKRREETRAFEAHAFECRGIDPKRSCERSRELTVSPERAAHG